MTTQTESIRITGEPTESQPSILTPQAVEFLLALHTRFEPARQSLLEERKQRQARLDAGEKPTFREDTRAVREGLWKVAPIPDDLRDRRDAQPSAAAAVREEAQERPDLHRTPTG